MPVEVEAKLRLPDAAAARKALAAAGVALRPPVRQQDTFFAWPGGDAQRAGRVLRVRRQQTGAGLVAFEVTYKGPRLGGQGDGVKSREELTLPVAADPGPLLEALGFAPSLRVAKSRQAGSWTGRDGRVVALALDEVDGLGAFLELEVVCGADERAAAQRSIEAAVVALGFAQAGRVALSYAELLAQRQGPAGSSA